MQLVVRAISQTSRSDFVLWVPGIDIGFLQKLKIDDGKRTSTTSHAAVRQISPNMSIEEAHALVKALRKADADSSHSNVQDVLQALHDFPGMNELILKETKLGKVVQGLKGKYEKENPDISKYVHTVNEDERRLLLLIFAVMHAASISWYGKGEDTSVF